MIVDEEDEVALAIYRKHPQLWPMSAYQALYVAEHELIGASETTVVFVADAMIKLNNPEAVKNVFQPPETGRWS